MWPFKRAPTEAELDEADEVLERFFYDANLRRITFWQAYLDSQRHVPSVDLHDWGHGDVCATCSITMRQLVAMGLT